MKYSRHSGKQKSWYYHSYFGYYSSVAYTQHLRVKTASILLMLWTAEEKFLSYKSLRESKYKWIYYLK